MPIHKIAALAAAAAALGIAGLLQTAPAAHADPPCAAFGTCRYLPDPSYNGPLMPTWDAPEYYGGWTTGPVLCDPVTYSCHGYVPAR